MGIARSCYLAAVERKGGRCGCCYGPSRRVGMCARVPVSSSRKREVGLLFAEELRVLYVYVAFVRGF